MKIERSSMAKRQEGEAPMWKMALAFLFIISLFGGSIAHADMDIEHLPTENQLQEKEAEKIACEFFYSLCGVELTGLYHLEKEKEVSGADAVFGPGYQYGVDTQEDCWSLDLRNRSHIWPRAVIHGTTGEILSWQYYDTITRCCFINALPQAEQLSLKEATSKAAALFSELLPEEDLSEENTYSGASFSLSEAALTGEKTELCPQWLVQLSFHDFILLVSLNADDGSILSAELTIYDSKNPVPNPNKSVTVKIQ